MATTRREFLTALGQAGIVGGAVGAPTPTEAAAVPAPKTAGARETTTVCPFCGVGCGQVVSVTEEVLSRLVLQTPTQQVVTIRRMQRMPESGIRPDQVPQIVEAFRVLSGQR